MLQTIRDRASGWFAYLVFGMLLIPFALWGINYYTHDGTAPFVARVNGEEIGLARYQQTLQNQRERLRQGGVQEVDENRLKHMIVGQLIDERLAEGRRVFALLREELPPARAAKLAAAITGAPRKELYAGEK